MRKVLEGSGLSENLIPSWDIGCKRLTPGPQYLEVRTIRYIDELKHIDSL